MPAFPLSVDPATQERYTLRDRADVHAYLHALASRRATATLYFGVGDEMLHTEIVAANPHFEELLFAPGHDAALQKRLLAGGEFGVETMIDSVRVLFRSRHAEPVPGREGVAFRARMPESVVRVQRRDTMRADTPADARPACSLRLNGRELTAPVLDVSSGGLGLEIADAGFALQPGDALKDCRIEIPALGALSCGLVVAYVKETGERHVRKAGCRFVELPATTRRQVSDYVARLERARLGT
jgi:c-di-GMP-binding flagellar brake protein YcgR